MTLIILLTNTLTFFIVKDSQVNKAQIHNVDFFLKGIEAAKRILFSHFHCMFKQLLNSLLFLKIYHKLIFSFDSIQLKHNWKRKKIIYFIKDY